ncbi:hypothetical protein I79_003410 [Cricetulus griseus]|uniref:Uncharacterized protein n=1 Tax=Cricetulus griseus TaxID=10029 RepID=G3GZW2_CRIGR|nr:hypothetical protein I79_003410 [Cricetulus griseus]
MELLSKFPKRYHRIRTATYYKTQKEGYALPQVYSALDHSFYKKNDLKARD